MTKEQDALLERLEGVACLLESKHANAPTSARYVREAAATIATLTRTPSPEGGEVQLAAERIKDQRGSPVNFDLFVKDAELLATAALAARPPAADARTEEEIYWDRINRENHPDPLPSPGTGDDT